MSAQAHRGVVPEFVLLLFLFKCNLEQTDTWVNAISIFYFLRARSSLATNRQALIGSREMARDEEGQKSKTGKVCDCIGEPAE